MKSKPSKKSTSTSTPSPGEAVRMNVNISKSFYKQIKQRALDEDKTITEIVTQALQEYLKQ